jgi:hypothetical protein
MMAWTLMSDAPRKDDDDDEEEEDIPGSRIGDNAMMDSVAQKLGSLPRRPLFSSPVGAKHGVQRHESRRQLHIQR